MNKYRRTDRVSNLIHHSVSEIIENELADSRIGMVTVTGVDIGKDLKNARVYISVLGDEKEVERSLKTLNNAAGFIRSRLGEKVVLRHIPTVRFFYDSSTVNGISIDKLFDEIKKET
ncbi:30S ribosome-binding factor RbfA [Candidatus Latescibacterota bacterium]